MNARPLQPWGGDTGLPPPRKLCTPSSGVATSAACKEQTEVAARRALSLPKRQKPLTDHPWMIITSGTEALKGHRWSASSWPGSIRRPGSIRQPCSALLEYSRNLAWKWGGPLLLGGSRREPGRDHQQRGFAQLWLCRRRDVGRLASGCRGCPSTLHLAAC